jgi:transposase-like protein
MSVSTGKKKQARGRPSLYPPEFRKDAVAMVLDEHRAIADVARSVGVKEGTLGNWVSKERVERGERAGLTTDERGELVDLRAENARLRMERDLLKRSLAFWVRETSTP